MEEKKKSGRGGKRIGAGRKTQRETANLLEKLKIYEDDAVKILAELALEKKDVQALKLYFSYLAGNPTTTSNVNSNVTAQVSTIDLREIITFDNTKDDDKDDFFDDL